VFGLSLPPSVAAEESGESAPPTAASVAAVQNPALESPGGGQDPDPPSAAPSSESPSNSSRNQEGQKAGDESDASELAKKTQNPVSDLISVPFQNNTTFNAGPDEDKTVNVLNIQPVYPFALDENWNVISRTIFPLIYRPSFGYGTDETYGLGDINQTFFVSPRKPGKVIWGVGPTMTFPSSTDDTLGTQQFSAGPAAVALTTSGPWVYGALANHQWSVAGPRGREEVNMTLIQPFVNYNLKDGWYINSAPIITCDWSRDDDHKWIVPVGAGVGKIVRLGKLPVNISVGGYYNVEAPKEAGDWTLRTQFTFLFPKGKKAEE
jgi:hypothetical protein